jgi:hypothetical protein
MKSAPSGRKAFLKTLLTASLLPMLAGQAASASGSGTVTASLHLEGRTLQSSLLIQDQRLLAPAKLVQELFLPGKPGAMKWDNRSKSVSLTITGSSEKVLFTIGSDVMSRHRTEADTSSAKTVKMGTEAVVRGGRAYIPLKDAAHAFGYRAAWSKDRQEVVLIPSIRDTSNLPSPEPGAVKSFLNAQQIKNGDIYLKDGLTYINIVGLTPEISEAFSERFNPHSYRLVDVKFSIEQLQQAQDALTEHDLYRKVNIYASSVEVIQNRLIIDMPDSAEARKNEIEAVVDKEMIIYNFQKLGEPQFVGKIAKVDEENNRILISVNDEPAVWFSFNSFSVIKHKSGEKASFSDFKVGQSIEGWAAGGIATSLPAQAAARQIVIMK